MTKHVSSPEQRITGAPKEAGATRALLLMSLVLVTAMSTWFSASAVVPQLREVWDLSDGQAAWLTIAVQLGFVTGALISALFNLSDILSPRLVVGLGAVGAAGANLAIVAVDGPGAAIPLRFLTGAFLAAVYPPSFKLMSTWFVEGRGVALGVLAGAIAVGSATPHLANALGGLDVETVLVTTSALTVIGALLLLLVKEGPYPFPKAVFDPRQLPAAIRNRGVRLASIGYFGHMWELFAMWAWFLVFFTEASGGNRRVASFVTFAVIAIGGVGSWFGGVLGDRWGRSNATTTLLGVSGTCSLTIGLLFDAHLALVTLVGLVWGFTVIADSAQFSTVVTEVADQAYVGTALTLQLAIGFTLTVVTIALIPYLEAIVGWRWAFAFLAPGPILGAVAMRRLKSSPYAAKIAGGRG